ncbi:MAG: helix-turn-helix domain-containing protein [Anaerolineae bacterium]|nr:helix-turn-helix domain-containing protein [Anaerolineae bacterium]
MESFGELLTRYMSRSGISDSELARHLGVSRQTIFRWKEGHTARPRERDDVLKIAARLRLSDTERDTLLLAAGFPPQSAPAIPAALAATEPAPQPLASAEPQLAPRTAPGASRTRPRWVVLLFVAVLTVLAAVASSVTFLNTLENSKIATVSSFPTPAAVFAEQIILLGRLQSGGGDPPNFDVTARVRQAIERELDAARLDRVRVVVSPNEITDPLTAETVRTRSGAVLALWGTYQGAATTLQLISPTEPTAQTLQINSSSPDNLRALALLLVAQLARQRSDSDLARAALTQALALPNLPAALQSYLATERKEIR